MMDRRRPGADRPRNLKTALLLGALALFFFISVFVKFLWLS